eukprot:6704900-Pyramimonas_sp.AAC.1
MHPTRQSGVGASPPTHQTALKEFGSAGRRSWEDRLPLYRGVDGSGEVAADGISAFVFTLDRPRQPGP